VSTARGGEPGSFEPGLEHLIGALTASGHPHELAGRDAARAAFVAASQQPTPAGSGESASTRSASNRSASSQSAWRRGPVRIALPARLAVAVAAVVAVLGGFTAAAAAQVLPAPVQRIAYSVLAPLGMPVSQPAKSPHRQSAAPRPPASATGPGSGGGGCPCPSASSQSAGSGTQHHPTRKPKAKAKKPDATPVLRLVSGRLDDRLIVAARSGRPGDIVTLAEWTDAAWTTVASAQLGPGRRAVFVLPLKTAAGHLFEAEVLEVASHPAVASNRLWIPHPAATGAKAIQTSPTTSPAGTGSPTPTPTATLAASTTPATSPAPTTSAAGTGGPTPTPTPDPSASGTASAALAPPQIPEPSSSSSIRPAPSCYVHHEIRTCHPIAVIVCTLGRITPQSTRSWFNPSAAGQDGLAGRRYGLADR
jgi:hypothetical protein